MATEILEPDWPAGDGVRALVTTRMLGDVRSPSARERLREIVPSEPRWLKQVHGTWAIDAATAPSGATADASFSRTRGVVCAVMVADCMPVLLAGPGVVGVAHAGWRGLAAGVLEETVEATREAPERLIAWLGPAIGPAAYEVGDEVRTEFVFRDPAAAAAFAPSRPGHWMLDLYAVARQRLADAGVTRVFGGGFCTHADAARFYSWRRDRAPERMAAAIWLA